jgi:hypothetical protein
LATLTGEVVNGRPSDPISQQRGGVFVFNQILKIERFIMKKSCLFLALVLLSLTFSCSGGGSSSGGSSGSGYLTGNWSGQWISTRYSGQGGSVNATFSQSGSQLSGTVFVTHTAAGDVSGNVSGTISNPSGPGTITIGVAYNNQVGSATFSGSYTDTRISGNYSASNGDSGTFVLSR